MFAAYKQWGNHLQALQFNLKWNSGKRRIECAWYGCLNTFYNSVAQATGILLFFYFHRRILISNVGVTLSKRQDGKGRFKVTKNTSLCHMHYMETDIRKTINQWRLKKGVFPSLQLHSDGCYSTVTKSRKEPKARESRA